MKYDELAKNKGAIPPYTEPAKRFEALSATQRDFKPLPAEVARRAYGKFLTENSVNGHDVRHWLAAENELIEERDPAKPHPPPVPS